MYYVLLAATAAIGAGIALRRTQRKAALVAAFFFSMAGVMVADWIAWGILRLYQYHPNLSASVMLDSAWGELLGDILFVPGVTVALLTTGSLLWTAVLGSLLFSAIEYFFVRAGLFTLTGWATWMTAVAFPVYFWGVWRFHQAALSRGLQDRRVNLVLRASLLFCVFAILALWLRVAEVTTITLHVMPTNVQNQSLGRLLTYLLIPGIFGLWVMAGPRASRLLAATLGLVLLNYLLSGIGLQTFQPPWTEVVDGVAQGLSIGIPCLVEDWLIKQEQTERRLAFNE